MRKSDIAYRVRNTLKLNENECKWENGAVVIGRQGGKHILEIAEEVSSVLKRYNNVKIKFTNCVFKKSIKLEQITFKDILYFIDSTFEEEVDFSRSIFEKRVFFSESTFKKKASFEEVIFEHNAYFDETIFEDEANFDMSEFCRHARFYGANFKEFPNFIQTIFDWQINLTNVELVSIESLEGKIDRVYKRKKDRYDKKSNKNPTKEPQKHKIINELRDSFRAIRSALIENNDMLDAEHYRTLERHCEKIGAEHKNSNQ